MTPRGWMGPQRGDGSTLGLFLKINCRSGTDGSDRQSAHHVSNRRSWNEPGKAEIVGQQRFHLHGESKR